MDLIDITDPTTRQVAHIAKLAMETGNALEFEYDGKPRLVEVHAIGKSTTGKIVMRAYQVMGDSQSGETEGFKLLNLGKIFEFPKMISIKSLAPRDLYKENDLAMIDILAQLEAR